MAWLPGFTNRTAIKIDSSKIDSDLTDFPVFIPIGSSVGIDNTDISDLFTDLASDSNRKKIAVTLEDGITQCYVEIESYDWSNSKMGIHVSVPTVYSSIDTWLYLYWDSAVTDNNLYVGDTGDAVAREVWDSDYCLVYHFNQDPTQYPAYSIEDSSKSEENSRPCLTFTSNDLVSAHSVSNGYDFDGVDDDTYSQGPDVDEDAASTLEAIIKPDSYNSGGHDQIVVNYRNDGYFGHSLELADGDIRATCVVSGSSKRALGGAISTSSFQYVAGTWESGSNVNVFLNTTKTVGDSGTGTLSRSGPLWNFGGADEINFTTRDFDGIISEFRASRIKRSDAWIKATSYTLSDNLLYYSAEVPEPPEDENDLTSWLGTWKQRVGITIDHEKIGSTLTNFPIYVPINSAAGLGQDDVTAIFDELTFPAVTGEDFIGTDGDDADEDYWTTDIVNSPDYLSIQNNKLNFNGPGNNENPKNQITSIWKLDGDFDVECDYTITTLNAPGNGVTYLPYLRVTDDDRQYGFIGRGRSPSYNKFYVKGTNRSDAWVGSAINTGKLRITRVSNVIRGYYWTGSAWSSATTLVNSSTAYCSVTLHFEQEENGAAQVDIDAVTINSGTVVWTTANPNRKKVAFTLHDNTQLYAEIDHYDSADEKAGYHVKIPSISAVQDTHLWMYFDSAQSDNTTYIGDTGDAVAQNVWDDDFDAVYHFNITPSGSSEELKDSTSNGYHFNGNNFDGNENSFVGSLSSVDFNGSDEYFSRSYTAGLDPEGAANLIWEGMVDFTQGDYCNLFTNQYNTNNFCAFYIRQSDRKLIFRHYQYASPNNHRTWITDDAITTGVHYLVVRYTEGAGGPDIYVDGVSVNYSVLYSTGSDDIVTSNTTQWIGRYYTGSGYNGGEIAEIRLTNGDKRSAAYVEATYYSLTDNLIQFGPITGWLQGWGNRIKIIINSDKVDSNLTDFPVCVQLSDSSGRLDQDVTLVFDHLSSYSNRKKIAATIQDGNTQCYVEIERWDSTNKEAVLHIKVPFVSSVINTVLYLYYDSTHADNTSYVGDIGDTPAQNVWDNNFMAVHHLAQDPSGGTNCMLDSTSNANHGTPAGSMASNDLVDGQVGEAIQFDGFAQYIDIGNISLSSVTVEGLAKTNYAGDDSMILGLDRDNASPPASRVFQFKTKADGDIEFICFTDNSTLATASLTPTAPANNNNWRYAAGRFDQSDIYVFLDTEKSSAASLSGALNTTSEPISIGAKPLTGDEEFHPGQLDEIRVSNTDRSDAWINATYYTLFDDFVTFDTYVPDATTVDWDSDWNILAGLSSDSAWNILAGCSGDINWHLLNEVEVDSDWVLFNGSFFECKWHLVSDFKPLAIYRLAFPPVYKHKANPVTKNFKALETEKYFKAKAVDYIHRIINKNYEVDY